MNNDLISREALKKEIIELNLDNTSHWAVIYKIDNAPTVTERPPGEWIYDSDHSITIDMYKCSVCGCFGHTHFKFCQNCGADMKGGKK